MAKKILTVTLLFIIVPFVFATQKTDQTLKNQIARMIVIGFDMHTIDKNSSIVKDLEKYPLGGVILFDRFYSDRTKIKNIESPQQLKALTQMLQNYAQKPLLISIDQEGGKVARLKPRDGFIKAPSAQQISIKNDTTVQKLYDEQSKMLQNMGINVNFAPVVDLALESKNKVIYGLQRSYGKDPKKVVHYAKLMINSQKKHQVISVLKHFPGHGSSLADSHEGFVDITQTWSPKELDPYKELIKDQYSGMIMSAHVFNKNLDHTYPATLSYNINTTLLRKQLGFEGVLISDDLQMKAISSHYNLQQTLALAINSGVDMVLFGNQLSFTNTEEIIETIYALVQDEIIPKKRILEANKRIDTLIQYNLSQSPNTPQ